MSRVKLSEYTAKKTLFPQYLGLSATSSVSLSSIARAFPKTTLVVKVDQGIKKRHKQGLIKLGCTPKEAFTAIQTWSTLGFSSFLLEHFIKHSPSSEHYLSLERVREGWKLSYSSQGGVEIESAWDSVNSIILPLFAKSCPPGTFKTSAPIFNRFLSHILPLMNQFHLSFLEINPLILQKGQLIPLDMACEIDNTASPLTGLSDHELSASELEIASLDSLTPASLKFRILNPSGHIWMILSGGGASLVLADEVADLGLGSELANYGEYSGAPSTDDVYAYTKIILSQLLQTQDSERKALVIAGGVANFTDVALTFRGLIKALSEQSAALKEANTKVFVRRGGPNESKGLASMQSFLRQSGLLGSVHGHETILPEVVSEVKKYLAFNPTSKPRSKK